MPSLAAISGRELLPPGDSSPAVAQLVESGDLSGIREYLNSGKAYGSYTMNSSLQRMLANGQISLADARNATTDRVGLSHLS